MKDLIERFKCCLTEDSVEAEVSNMLSEFKVSEMQKIIEYLVSTYESRKYLLEEFWKHKSDACPLESEAQEDQILAFRRYITNRD